VKEGVVMPRDGADGEKVLVAYVVLEGSLATDEGAEPSCAAAIRRHMVEHLPDYMVPAIYLELPKLPLNHNMKVDRRALPAPGETPPRRLRRRAPRTATETALAKIWQELLDVETVGLDDNFFELGGHSLLAVSLLSRGEQVLGVQIDAMDVLREPLEVLARICDARLGKECRGPLEPVARIRDFRVEPLHFGPGNGLYGVVTSPTQARAETAVLVCGPVGQENVRAHFVLRSFAKHLAAEGVASMHFDYYGTGDSHGESILATCSRWQEDIAWALAELVKRTGAKRVTAVGVRFGATLLAQIAPKLQLARLVFWDPVTNGAGHFAEMQKMQDAYQRGAERFTFRRRRTSNGVELLATTYSARALAEARSLVMPHEPPTVPVKWLVTSPPGRAMAAFERISSKPEGSRLSWLKMDCEWGVLRRLEDLLPDVGVAAELATLCMEES
jgi:alpha/beta superfamily hydrolase